MASEKLSDYCVLLPYRLLHHICVGEVSVYRVKVQLNTEYKYEQMLTCHVTQ